jgi:hypothetical protein
MIVRQTILLLFLEMVEKMIEYIFQLEKIVALVLPEIKG